MSWSEAALLATVGKDFVSAAKISEEVMIANLFFLFGPPGEPEATATQALLSLFRDPKPAAGVDLEDFSSRFPRYILALADGKYDEPDGNGLRLSEKLERVFVSTLPPTKGMALLSVLKAWAKKLMCSEKIHFTQVTVKCVWWSKEAEAHFKSSGGVPEQAWENAWNTGKFTGGGAGHGDTGRSETGDAHPGGRNAGGGASGAGRDRDAELAEHLRVLGFNAPQYDAQRMPTKDEIKTNYRTRALQSHPDKQSASTAHADMQALNAARDFLLKRVEG
jgi:hypothetical protein